MAEWDFGIGDALGGVFKWGANNANWLAPLAQAGGTAYSYLQQGNANRAQQQANQQGIAAQQAAGQQQIALQQNAYNDSRADLAPYRQAGVNALSQYAANANTPFGQSPDYAFRYNEGIRGVQNLASSQGLLNSGRAVRAATDYGQGAASQEYGNYMNRLASLTGIGQQANSQGVTINANLANQQGSILGNTANSLTSLYGQGGQINAAGAMQGANALNGGVNNLFNYWQQGGGAR